jgi:hypothetical protein
MCVKFFAMQNNVREVNMPSIPASTKDQVEEVQGVMSKKLSCEKVAVDTSKSQFYVSFWRSNLISCERVAAEAPKSQFYLSF